jgi:hypothetical protein
MLLELDNETKIDLYNPTYSEMEKLAEFTVKEYMKNNSANIEQLEELQDENSIFYLIYNDINRHNSWAGIWFISVLKNKYKIEVSIR